MAGDTVAHNLDSMDDVDFKGWNRADWDGVFARHHTHDVLVEVHGQPPTRGIGEHIQSGLPMFGDTFPEEPRQSRWSAIWRVSSTRELTPSLVKMLRRWPLTV